MTAPVFPMATTVYAVPKVRLQRRLRRLTRSPFAADVRAAVAAAFWPAVVGCGLLTGLAMLWITRGSYIGWTGAHDIPAGVAGAVLRTIGDGGR